MSSLDGPSAHCSRWGRCLTLSVLWINAEIGHIIPSPDQINWELRTVIVVVLDFLIPATVLGMVGPVVAKMAVEQARKAGSAIGDVYFWGAIGSIAGTFLCGFVLMLPRAYVHDRPVGSRGAGTPGSCLDRRTRRAWLPVCWRLSCWDLARSRPLVNWLNAGRHRPGLLQAELPRCWPATSRRLSWESWVLWGYSAPAATTRR